MSRVINADSPGKRRNAARRTIAEILRHLIHKRELDDETKDMAAALVLNLQEIADTVETTTAAWEKRDYYLKADRFRLEWEWVDPTACHLQSLILEGRWEELPQALVKLAPHFADIRIAKMTRAPSAWRGSYELLLKK
ncbi:MAG: hypothetical protein H5T69_00735 [Chloroflexi bacterium]|nr:hypothetical protein [Chloroflexota bacterium]